MATTGGWCAPLQVTPLSVNTVGFGFWELTSLPLKPMLVDPLVARLAFQPASWTVTFAPLCVQVPLQPLATVWPPEKLKASTQPLMAGPLFVIVMPTLKP